MAQSEFPSIEASRGRILESLGQPPDVTLVSCAVGIGDTLALAGTRALLSGVDHREIAVEELSRAGGHTAILVGGGFSRRHHDIGPRALVIAAMRFEQVIVLPSPFDPSEETVAGALAATSASVFASDPESYRRIAPLCDAALAHDCAFFFDFTPYRREGTGVLNAFRSDRALAQRLPLPEGNDDISRTAADLDAWLAAIASHELVRTDRLHVLIAGALMDKRVEYTPAHPLDSTAHGALRGHRLDQLSTERADRVGTLTLDSETEATLERARATALATPPPSLAQSSAEPRVTAIIPTRDRPELLLRALDALERTEVPLRTIVIDNDSGPEGAGALEAICAGRPRTELHRSPQNLGVSGARNLGTSLAETELLLFLDDDAELMPGALEHLVGELDAHREAEAVTATVIRPDGTIFFSGGAMEVSEEMASFSLLCDGAKLDEADVPPTGPSGWVPGTALLLRRSLSEQFPREETMRPYFDDNEWSYRVWRLRPDAFRRSKEAFAVHHSDRQLSPPVDFASRSAAAALLASYARFYELHGLLLGPWLFDHVPELRAADGSCDRAAARLLMELVSAKGTDWALMEWMNGELKGLLTANQRLVELREARVTLARERTETARLRARAAQDEHTIASLDASLNATSRRLRRIEGSVTWQLFQRLRSRLFELLGGEDSPRVSAVQRALRFIGRKLRTKGSVAGPGRVPPPARQLSSESIAFPGSEHPEVSIVIPLYAHAELTRVALESILEHTTLSDYELILVDDSTDSAIKDLLGQVRGARIIVNESNLGYGRSIKRGAAEARGRWLVLCNNDIEVRPGWLTALLDCGESGDDIAIVSPKFLYPDGLIAEAGGIIWNDGTGENYGRRQEPTCCHYEYRREIDYGSAAALMVKAEFWKEVGGFDERFLPMYFEDVDLCFQARAHGMRVMYEPRAHVIHVEGATAGVDEAVGHKRHQQENRPRFVAKWRDRLATEHLRNERRNVWLGANLRRHPHVLVVDHRMPTWDYDAGGLRMRAMLESLIELGCHVSFLPDNLIPTQPYTRVLQRTGVEVLYRVEVEEALSKIGSSSPLVILSRAEVAGRWLETVREHAPEATTVFDTVDLHWVREERRAALAGAAGSNGGDAVARAGAMRTLEHRLIRDTEATVVVSEVERAQVQEAVPGTTVYVMPTVNELRLDVAPATRREGVLFVGGFEHDPNLAAVMTLVRDVMPLVWRELPDLTVTLVGADPPAEVQALVSPLVDVRGWVPDLDPLIDSARALVAPITYGAGLKGKITQALAAGLPVVTTPIGAEGLDAVDGEHMLIGQTAEELADRVIRVCRDPDLWQRLSSSGQQLASECCSRTLMKERLRGLLADVEGGKLQPQPLSLR